MQIKKYIAIAFTVLFSLASCSEGPADLPENGDGAGTENTDKGETPEKEEPLTNIVNTYADKYVSFRGTTVSVKFDPAASWNASLENRNPSDTDWVSFIGTSAGGDADKGSTVRIDFEKNDTPQTRSVELWVTVEGFDAVKVATLIQAANGTSVDAELNLTLNTYMHEILKKDYLFNDRYNAQETDLTVSFADFLNTHLLDLEGNVEDGGYYRSTYGSNAGKRFIYTNIAEIQVGTKAVQTVGLGFGPFISTALAQGSAAMALAPSYVRLGSPAEAAGLRRGDLIYAVNGAQLNTSTYRNYMDVLYANPSGTYQFSFLRFEPDGKGAYALNAYESKTVSAQAHVYDPVLHASILSDPDDKSVKIGYLVYESFDVDSQEFLKETVKDFAEAGITDLILDLRFNAGGAVAQSRWLSGCIAGQANWEKTFTKVVYNDGSTENWTFNYGYSNDTDNLGLPIDLGLKRLFVITSYNTASAAELVISSLRGVDFPVKMIGVRTEGKNVGMTVSETSYKGRHFIFSPVTFYVRNAKDWGDYKDGIEVDEAVNNDNGIAEPSLEADDVFPYSFSDWGNMDYNIALQWAYCEITGKDRWKDTPKTKAVAGHGLSAVDFQPMSLTSGHYGNLIPEKQ